MSPASPGRRPARSAPAARRPNPSRPSPAAPSRRLPIALLAGIGLAAGLIAVIVLTMASGGSVEVGSPTVTGDALPDFGEFAQDPALGLPIPEVTGAGFDGTAAAITRDGRPKVIMFFAHWCGVCQEEMPLVADWLPTADLPETVEVIAVSTGVSKSKPNYPPSEWFASEGWPAPVIMDDEPSSVAAAFGLTAYPYFVFVDADGNVALRLIGRLPVAAIASALNELAGS